MTKSEHDFGASARRSEVSEVTGRTVREAFDQLAKARETSRRADAEVSEFQRILGRPAPRTHRGGTT